MGSEEKGLLSKQSRLIQIQELALLCWMHHEDFGGSSHQRRLLWTVERLLEAATEERGAVITLDGRNGWTNLAQQLQKLADCVRQLLLLENHLGKGIVQEGQIFLRRLPKVLEQLGSGTLSSGR